MLLEKKVSVIIPFYNRVDWLAEAVQSVLAQTYQNIEIIVINDGSMEDISDFLFKFGRNILYCYKENGGPASARNLGIEKSQGEYLAFLDSDDIWLPQKIKEMISFMEGNNFKWCHSDYIRFNDFNLKEKYVKCFFEGNIVPKCFVWNPIATPCVIISKSLLYDTNYRFAEWRRVGEDHYLWLRLGENNKLGYLPKALVKVRMRGKNASVQAHLQLKFRGELKKTLIDYKDTFNSIFVYYYLLCVLSYCYKSFSILSVFIRYIKCKNASFELLFKAVYFFPFINFKILKRII